MNKNFLCEQGVFYFKIKSMLLYILFLFLLTGVLLFFALLGFEHLSFLRKYQNTIRIVRKVSFYTVLIFTAVFLFFIFWNLWELGIPMDG